MQWEIINALVKALYSVKQSKLYCRGLDNNNFEDLSLFWKELLEKLCTACNRRGGGSKFIIHQGLYIYTLLFDKVDRNMI